MAIITVTSYKGGVGKTTTAMHLAGYFAALGPTVLVDGDPNRSATDWGRRGDGLPFEIVDERAATKAARSAQHVIIDTEARPTVEDLTALVSGCDLLVVPSTPDALALDALLKTVKALKGIKGLSPDAYRILITKAPPAPSRDAAEARAALEEMGLPLFAVDIPHRVAFQRATESGVLVHQTKMREAAHFGLQYTHVGEEVRRVIGEGAAA